MQPKASPYMVYRVKKKGIAFVLVPPAPSELIIVLEECWFRMWKWQPHPIALKLKTPASNHFLPLWREQCTDLEWRSFPCSLEQHQYEYALLSIIFFLSKLHCYIFHDGKVAASLTCILKITFHTLIDLPCLNLGRLLCATWTTIFSFKLPWNDDTLAGVSCLLTSKWWIYISLGLLC